MADLRTLMDGKTVLIFAARDARIVTMLFQEYGATTIVVADHRHAIETLRQRTVDGALLNVSVEPSELFDISEELAARGIPYVFAADPGADMSPAFKGFLFPVKLSELRVIATRLFSHPRFME
jgi:hypothetical protein